MIKKINIDLKSVRLDRYYSGQSILEDFSENTMIFIIPKKNSRIRGRSKWREIIRRFMDDPMNYPSNTSRGMPLNLGSPMTRGQLVA